MGADDVLELGGGALRQCGLVELGVLVCRPCDVNGTRATHNRTLDGDRLAREEHRRPPLQPVRDPLELEGSLQVVDCHAEVICAEDALVEPDDGELDDGAVTEVVQILSS
jgi:hypothetical protein